MATALLFNFTDTQKLQKIRFALFKLGIAGRIVDAADFHQPVGHLCGLEGFSGGRRQLFRRDAGAVRAFRRTARRAADRPSPQPCRRAAQGGRNRGKRIVERQKAAR